MCKSQKFGLLLGGQRIRNERNKCWQPAESGAIGSEPGGIARRKISSGYEVKLKKLGNALIHDLNAHQSVNQLKALDKLLDHLSFLF